MSSPAEYYHSLPPICKAYGTLCVAVTTVCSLGLLDLSILALEYKLVFSKFQVWRLITNFFFLGTFSINFGIRLLMIARYGVNLEKGPFERRTADFLWMMIFGALSLLVLSAIPIFRSYFLGISLVFMLVYVWSREFPNSQINIYGLVTLKAFYLPWAMLALDVIFGSPLVPDLLGIIAGHLYYFLTVLHPLATGKNLLKTPKWVYPYFYWFLRVKNYAAPSNPPGHSAGCVKPNIIRDIFSLSTQAHTHVQKTHVHTDLSVSCSSFPQH